MAEKKLSAAEAAKLVHRLVPQLGKDGKPTGEMDKAPVTEAEVLSFREDGNAVIVVTIAGEKLFGELKGEKK
ncbi:hypothetical protein [Ferrovibrio terrae]|uniref:hypothetical protein n=1 Tax=Ferrovibrio terrae TaxID=2594003 RepID=UPI0031379D83